MRDGAARPELRPSAPFLAWPLLPSLCSLTPMGLGAPGDGSAKEEGAARPELRPNAPSLPELLPQPSLCTPRPIGLRGNLPRAALLCLATAAISRRSDPNGTQSAWRQQWPLKGGWLGPELSWLPPPFTSTPMGLGACGDSGY